MVQLRNYTKSDFSAVQNVCFVTSYLSHTDTAKSRQIICNLYCDYYLQRQAEHCFVAECNNTPIGYVLCCVDGANFANAMQQVYLPTVKKLSFFQWLAFSWQMKQQQKFAVGYSAHLHVDVLPQFQRQGIGTRLLDLLFCHLESIGVDGVYLVCAKSNKNAVNFYKKYGFQQIGTMPSCIVFGKKIFSEGKK